MPVAKEEPPDAAEYQLIVPDEEAALNLTVPLLQVEPAVVVTIVGIGLAVAVTAVLLAVVQPFVVAST